MGKNSTDFAVVQKFKQEISELMSKKSDCDLTTSRAEQQQAASIDSPSVHTPPESVEQKPSIFQRLTTETMRKRSARSGSPISRKRFLELQELKECSFKPRLGELSQELAQRRYTNVRYRRIEDELLVDAVRRAQYKRQLELNVSCEICLHRSRTARAGNARRSGPS